MKKNVKENKGSNTSEWNLESNIVEYRSYFFTDKNKKIPVKNLAENTVLINNFFFEYINGYNIPNSFIKKINDTSIAFNKTDDFSFIVKIINSADIRTAKIFSIKPRSILELPIIEYHFGNSKESIITESHLISFNLCSYDELKMMNRLCSKVNAIVKSFFERRNTTLLELTCMFGKFEGKILLIGDFSPLGIKISDSTNNETLPDPYKLESTAQMNKYSSSLIKLINGF